MHTGVWRGTERTLLSSSSADPFPAQSGSHLFKQGSHNELNQCTNEPVTQKLIAYLFLTSWSWETADMCLFQRAHWNTPGNLSNALVAGKNRHQGTKQLFWQMHKCLEHNFCCNTQYGSIAGDRWAISSLDQLFQNPSIPQNIAHLLAKFNKWTLKVFGQQGGEIRSLWQFKEKR